MDIQSDLSIYLAHLSEETRDDIGSLIPRVGHKLMLSTDSGKALIQACANKKPALVITGMYLADMEGVEAVKKAYEYGPFPAILTTNGKRLRSKVLKALEDHVMACLTEPVREKDLQANIPMVYQRFREMRYLWKENRQLKEALRNRKVIERAKGILMRQQGLDEQSAHTEMQNMARNSRLKMTAIAHAIVDAEDYGAQHDRQKEIDSP